METTKKLHFDIIAFQTVSYAHTILTGIVTNKYKLHQFLFYLELT